MTILATFLITWMVTGWFFATHYTNVSYVITPLRGLWTWVALGIPFTAVLLFGSGALAVALCIYYGIFLVLAIFGTGILLDKNQMAKVTPKHVLFSACSTTTWVVLIAICWL